MNTKHGTDKYAAQRALNQLEALRASDDWAGDTAILPKLQPATLEELETTQPMLPGLLRPQAE